MKTILITILAVLSVVLVGVLGWQNWGDIVSKINPQKIVSCVAKTDCVLAYTGTDACAPCDPADDSMQCVSSIKATNLQQERKKRYGIGLCRLKCLLPPQKFVCVCQNDGSCAKVAVSQPVVSQPTATTSDETAGWKKHGNVYAGYGVNYPNDWIVDSPQIYEDAGSQIKFYSELFHSANKEDGNIAIVLYEFPSDIRGKISLAEAVKRVTGISSGEQVKIGRFDALKVGQWPDLGMPNGAYFLLYPSGTLFGINYTSKESETKKIFESMASSLSFMPSQ